MKSSDIHILDMDADRALFEGELEGLVLTCYENERPLSGLVGLMDWRFNGAISDYIKQGTITGKRGECTYVPVTKKLMTKHQKLYHLILVGGGNNHSVGKRDGVSDETFKLVQKNLATLKLARLGLSKKDFGNISEDALAKNLKGVPLWLTH
jgi:hypothetical protein